MLLLVLAAALILGGCGGEPRTLTSITVTPNSITVGINQSQQFFATAYDSAGQTLSRTFTWSVSGGIGSIDSNGLFRAGSLEGTGYVTAVADSISGNATVAVSQKGWISGLITDTDGKRGSYINVILTDMPSISASSDINGNYTLSNVPAGTHEVKTLENVNYIPSTREAVVSSGASTVLNITLTPRVTVIPGSDTESRIFSTITINGTLRNNGSTEAKGVVVTYLYYNSAGTLIGSGLTNQLNITAEGTRSYSIAFSLDEISYASKTRTISVTSY